MLFLMNSNTTELKENSLDSEDERFLDGKIQEEFQRTPPKDPCKLIKTNIYILLKRNLENKKLSW